MANLSFAKTAAAVGLCVLMLAACSKTSAPTPPPAPRNPTVTNLSVSEGPFDIAVTVTGTNFSSTLSDDHVYFNGVEASIVSATPTELAVSVPKGAGTGPVTVTVKGTSAAGPTFTYVLSPVVSTLAGNGDAFYADGSAVNASFEGPQGLAIGNDGMLYIADSWYSLIRKVTPQGVVSTIAGNPAVTNGHANGQGSAATFFGPTDIATDNAGNVYVADLGNHVIRMITPAGAVTTFAGNGVPENVDGREGAASFSSPTGIALGPSGNLYVSDGVYVRKITPDGTVSTMAGGPAVFGSLWGIAVDGNENIFVSGNRSRIWKITPAGQVSPFAGSDAQGASDGIGTAATFNYPYGLVVGPDNNLYVADGLNHKIRKITPAGAVTTFAGSGTKGYADGAGNAALFNAPDDIVFDAHGALYVTDYGNNRIRRIILQ